ncbi:hypothetical protein BVC80_143g12 [Macleaya cordata]|uniref:MULE transposase domain-containing protein n=1 Tax=Macleaya cordata TaxID=56857 RepID=A0A200R7V9_MACCD|nr:hypothetical protein BVC80_143g12 [Macleaya cordata]
MTSLDAQNGVVPLGILICKTENYENWKKFLECMMDLLTRNPRKLTFMSDRQKGLRGAVEEVFKELNHNYRFCFRHLYKNFKGTYKGKMLESLAWNTAMSYKKTDFYRWIEDLDKIDHNAHEYLVREEPKSWSRAYFEHSTQCEVIVNNFPESFNKMILKMRDKPIWMIGEMYNDLVMKTFYKRRALASSWEEGALVPTVQSHIDSMKNNIQLYTFKATNDFLFEVSNSARTRWQVNIREKRYKSDWGKPSTPVKGPIGDHNKPGRQKMARRRGQDEGNPSAKKLKTCKECGKIGHNIRTCSRLVVRQEQEEAFHSQVLV